MHGIFNIKTKNPQKSNFVGFINNILYDLF